MFGIFAAILACVIVFLFIIGVLWWGNKWTGGEVARALGFPDPDKPCCDGSVLLRIPDHMAEYRNNRVLVGLGSEVGVDRCLVPEIKSLWAAGVHTRGCCCGHGRFPGYINIYYRHEQSRIILERLGYERAPNPFRNENDPPDTYYAKTPKKGGAR